MRSERWLRLMSGLVLVGVFAAGSLFGAALMRWNDRGPANGPPPGPIGAMTRELALDPEQVATLHTIADAHHAELETIARTTQPKVRQVLFAIEDELRPHLRPDQVERLEAWRKRRPPPPMPGMGPPPGGPP